ncbi:DNA recombination protein RmuC [Tunturiibacter empetritectus]|uniref:DNA recombination protein RmuC n=1 Tax=Tunturiibacter empetritectus TaxID=3069691 RepID=UPI003D9AF944
MQNGLNAFRSDNKTSDEVLRTAVQQNLDAIAQRLSYFIAEVNRNQIEAREALHSRLNELSGEANDQQEKLRFTVEDRLSKLNDANTAKLEEMRVTVDEKLHATLQTRLTESFGQVTTHLGEVQKGLGEMKELATGVGDLKRVLSNVKSRGVVGEFQLGQQLEQMFSPEQYIKNARIKPGTLESVEYALKFPSGEGADSHTLLAIDAKFPKEDWERLEHAYETGTVEEIAAAGRAFERGIRAEGKRICDKYIDPPTTMPHAIMFLPTENLYAEVVRRPGLQSEIQSTYRVTIAGPSTFMAILTSFQMGFHTLAIQKKGDEVWRVLSSAKRSSRPMAG